MTFTAVAHRQDFRRRRRGNAALVTAFAGIPWQTAAVIVGVLAVAGLVRLLGGRRRLFHQFVGGHDAADEAGAFGLRGVR